MAKRVYLTTAYKKVNHFFDNTNENLAKELKLKKMKEINDEFFDSDFEALIFDKKKYDLLDEVVYKTRLQGVFHTTATKIKEKTNSGKTTLAQFNNLLHDSGSFIVARYRTRFCNLAGLIYIDVNHKNFLYVMQFLFGMNEAQTKAYLANGKQNGLQNEPQKSSESADEPAPHKGSETGDEKSNNTSPSLKSSKDYTYKDKLHELLHAISNKHNYVIEDDNKFYAGFKSVYNKFKNKIEEQDLLMLCKKALVETFVKSKSITINSIKNYGCKVFKAFASESINPTKPISKEPSVENREVANENNDIKLQIAKEKQIPVDAVTDFDVMKYISLHMNENKNATGIDWFDNQQHKVHVNESKSTESDSDYWEMKKKEALMGLGL